MGRGVHMRGGEGDGRGVHMRGGEGDGVWCAYEGRGG